MRLAIVIAGVLLSAAASAQELRPPPSVAPAQIVGSTNSGRAVLTGTPSQGATALGLGTGDGPTLAALSVSSPSSGTSVQALRVSSPPTASGTSTTVLRLEKGPNYGGEVAGYLTQGVGGGLRFSVLNGGGPIDVLRLDSAGAATFLGLAVPASYTVATLPTGTAGAQIYVTNGRKVGEASGAGTGVPAYYSNNSWRRYSDDTPVAQ